MGEQELLKMQQRKLSPFVLPDPSGTELLEGSFESILKSLSSGIISLSNTVLSAVAGFAAKIPGTFMRTVITIGLTKGFYDLLGFQHVAERPGYHFPGIQVHYACQIDETFKGPDICYIRTSYCIRAFQIKLFIKDIF